jgi:hypothetical protein
MPMVRWNAFNGVHIRPDIVFADVVGGRRRQARYSLLDRLASAMHFKGDYALFPDKDGIRVVFELGAEAQAFAGGLMAQASAREGAWSGQWAFNFDAGMEDKINEVLKGEPRRRWRKVFAVRPKPGVSD